MPKYLNNSDNTKNSFRRSRNSALPRNAPTIRNASAGARRKDNSGWNNLNRSVASIWTSFYNNKNAQTTTARWRKGWNAKNTNRGLNSVHVKKIWVSSASYSKHNNANNWTSVMKKRERRNGANWRRCNNCKRLSNWRTRNVEMNWIRFAFSIICRLSNRSLIVFVLRVYNVR